MISSLPSCVVASARWSSPGSDATARAWYNAPSWTCAAALLIALGAAAIVRRTRQGRRAAELSAALSRRDAAGTRAAARSSAGRTQECARARRGAGRRRAPGGGREARSCSQAPKPGCATRSRRCRPSAAAEQPVVPRAGADLARRVPADGRIDLDGRQKAIEDLVQPLKESLTPVDGKLQQVEQNRVGTQSALTEQLRVAPRRRSRRCRSETGRLVAGAALAERPRPVGRAPAAARRRSAGHARVLRLRSQGVGHADGGRLTPDLIVRLPGGKNVVVDAKVRSSAFLDAMETEDESAARRQAARSRAAGARPRRQARQQDLLAALPAGAGPGDHVRAGRDAAQRALQRDPALLEFSLGRGVMLASPLDADGAAARGRVRLAAGEDRARTRRRSASSAGSSTIASA